MELDDDVEKFTIWWVTSLGGLLVAVILLSFFCFVLVDYWNGTAKASLIKKQTGIEYTWREAAQIENMYDQNNVRINFDGDKKK